MKMFRNPEGVHAPIAYYSHQVEVREPARWLVVSGQLGLTLDGEVPEDPIGQLDIAFRNVVHNLHAANMSVGDLVKLTIYLVGEVDVQGRRAVIAGHLGEHRPAVTMVFIAALADARYKVEVEAWACSSAQA